MSNGINKRYDWFFGDNYSDIIKDKKMLQQSYIDDMLSRTQEMFIYEGLPETIPARELELMLQCKGYAVITEVDGKLYALYGGLGEDLDVYYFPTKAIISNPYLPGANKSFTKTIHEDCVVVKNDAMLRGVLPVDYKYASLLAEVDISLRYGCFNSRLMKIIKADNDSYKKDAEDYLEKIWKGEDMGVISGTAFLEGVKTEDYNSTKQGTVKELIELRQYLWSSWFIERGLNANYNMKREAINENESGMNEDSLAPLVDNMLKHRKLGFDEVNQMYGTNITVRLGSSWKEVHDDYFNNKEENKEDKEEESNEIDRNDQ